VQKRVRWSATSRQAKVKPTALCHSRKKKFLFMTQTQPYDKDDAFHLLVQRVEALLSKESSEWVQSLMKPPEEENRA
jgi:hypothetical protein